MIGKIGNLFTGDRKSKRKRWSVESKRETVTYGEEHPSVNIIGYDIKADFKRINSICCYNDAGWRMWTDMCKGEVKTNSYRWQEEGVSQNNITFDMEGAVRMCMDRDKRGGLCIYRIKDSDKDISQHKDELPDLLHAESLFEIPRWDDRKGESLERLSQLEDVVRKNKIVREKINMYNSGTVESITWVNIPSQEQDSYYNLKQFKACTNWEMQEVRDENISNTIMLFCHLTSEYSAICFSMRRAMLCAIGKMREWSVNNSISLSNIGLLYMIREIYSKGWKEVSIDGKCRLYNIFCREKFSVKIVNLLNMVGEDKAIIQDSFNSDSTLYNFLLYRESVMEVFSAIHHDMLATYINGSEVTTSMYRAAVIKMSFNNLRYNSSLFTYLARKITLEPNINICVWQERKRLLEITGLRLPWILYRDMTIAYSKELEDNEANSIMGRAWGKMNLFVPNYVKPRRVIFGHLAESKLRFLCNDNALGED